MIKTKCNKCGAMESTAASVGAKCFFCNEGIMKTAVFECGCDKNAGLLCPRHNDEMGRDICGW